MTIRGWFLNRLMPGLIAIMVPGVVHAADFRADVFRVIDGDTLEVRHHGRSERIHVEGIDCPELKQPYGKEAKRAVMALVIGSPVMVKTYGRSHDGAIRADVLLENGRRLSQILLEEGLAWKVTTADSPRVDSEEEGARYAKRGLWADPSPTPPWKYRAAQMRKRR
jgi:endonuclease YncB( thermonuclease family)